MSGAVGTVVYDFQKRALVPDSAGNPEWITQAVAVSQSATDNPPGAGRDPRFGPSPGFSSSLTTNFAGSFTTLGNNIQNSLNFGSSGGAIDYASYHPNVVAVNNGKWYPSATDTPGVYGPATPGSFAATLVGAAGTNWNHSAPLSAEPGGGPLDGNYGPNGLGTVGRVEFTSMSGYLNSYARTIPIVGGAFSTADLRLDGLFGLNWNWTTETGDTSLVAFTPLLIYALSGSSLYPLLNNPSGHGTISHVGGQYVMQIPISIASPYQLSAIASSEGTLGLGPRIGSANYAAFQFVGTITAVAVPEPAGVALAVAAFVGLLLMQRGRVAT